MIKIYQDNGLPFFDGLWIRDRRYAEDVLAATMIDVLIDANEAWKFHRIEAPCLIPEALISKEYDAEDVYYLYPAKKDDNPLMGLKPETTASSYEYARYLLEHQKAKPPLCVYQASKSFRRENDQVTKNVRLKEFYQMEFQCIVTADTKMDYQGDEVIGLIRQVVERLTGLPARVVPSDRLPSYSEKTLDIEVDTIHKWLEVCSISKRTDVPFMWHPTSGGKRKEPSATTKLFNYEFAFGLDRLVYAMRAE